MKNHIETENTSLTTETGERSPVWGAILYQDFAGSISELSALTKYFYQHLKNVMPFLSSYEIPQSQGLCLTCVCASDK